LGNELRISPVLALIRSNAAFTVAVVQSRQPRRLNNGVVFSVHGTRSRANTFWIAGQDNTDKNNQKAPIQGRPPPKTEAVREVTVLTNSHSAEIRRGGVLVTTLFIRWNNYFHGSRVTHRNSHSPPCVFFPAQSGSPASPTNLWTTQTFGFTFGCPIRKTTLRLRNVPWGTRARERGSRRIRTYSARCGHSLHCIAGPQSPGSRLF